jgi:transcriptional regulator with XRE-family HTH domain
MAGKQTPSDVVAARVREVREKRRMTTVDLAARCAALGAPQLTVQALYKLEGRRESPASHRPRPVTVDELLALAAALNVAPVCLLVPPDDYQEPYVVTATVTKGRFAVRAWIRGVGPLLGDDDPREFYAELPRGEFYTPGHMTSDGEAWVSGTQQGPPLRKESDPS